MDGLKSSFSNMPYAFIFLFFSSIGIMQLYEGPLVDPTPSSQVNAGLSPKTGHQKIPAKIWEEPFEGAHSYVKKNPIHLATTSSYLVKGIFETLAEQLGTTDQFTCESQCLAELKNKIHI